MLLTAVVGVVVDLERSARRRCGRGRAKIKNVEITAQAGDAVKTAALSHGAARVGLVKIHNRVTALERARNGGCQGVEARITRQVQVHAVARGLIQSVTWR